MTKPQYSGPWRRIRAQVLERDDGLCQIRGPRCTGVATAVDHIIPVARGGSDDLSNLQPLQWENNRAKSDGPLVCVRR